MPVVMVECEPIVIFDGSQGKSFELTLSENVVLQTWFRESNTYLHSSKIPLGAIPFYSQQR